MALVDRTKYENIANALIKAAISENRTLSHRVNDSLTIQKLNARLAHDATLRTRIYNECVHLRNGYSGENKDMYLGFAYFSTFDQVTEAQLSQIMGNTPAVFVWWAARHELMDASDVHVAIMMDRAAMMRIWSSVDPTEAAAVQHDRGARTVPSSAGASAAAAAMASVDATNGDVEMLSDAEDWHTRMAILQRQAAKTTDMEVSKALSDAKQRHAVELRDAESCLRTDFEKTIGELRAKLSHATSQVCQLQSEAERYKDQISRLQVSLREASATHSNSDSNSVDMLYSANPNTLSASSTAAAATAATAAAAAASSSSSSTADASLLAPVDITPRMCIAVATIIHSNKSLYNGVTLCGFPNDTQLAMLMSILPQEGSSKGRIYNDLVAAARFAPEWMQFMRSVKEVACFANLAIASRSQIEEVVSKLPIALSWFVFIGVHPSPFLDDWVGGIDNSGALCDAASKLSS